MGEIKVISKTLNEEEFMDAIMQAQTTPNVAVLLQYGCEIPCLRKAEIHPMIWKGLFTIKTFEDPSGQTKTMESPTKPEVVYIFGENIKKIEVINKTLRTEEEFMDAIMQAKLTPNVAVLVEPKKRNPFIKAESLITLSTDWDDLCDVVLFRDLNEQLHVFDKKPEIPETIFVFDFE